MNNMNRSMLVAVVSVSLFSVSARTLAIWPLCDNKASPAITGNCVNDSRFDLTPNNTALDATTPGAWNLPPNPDAMTLRGRPVAIRGSAASTDDGTINCAHFYSANETLAGCLLPTNDFTVEGWARVDSFNTSVSTWRIIMQAGNGSSNHGGWTLSLRKDADSYYLNFYASNLLNPVSGDLKYYKFIDGSSTVTDKDIIGSWHHYALTFSYYGLTAGKSTYRVYFDGRLVGTYEYSRLAPEQLTSRKPSFELGGRTATAAPRIVGAFSYWRLSDEALSTSAFLNAGGAGSKVDPDPELAAQTALYLRETDNGNKYWVDTGSRIKSEVSSTNCTFETWVCPLSTSAGHIVSQFSGSDYRSNWIFLKGSDGKLYMRFGLYDSKSGWVYFDSKCPVRLCEWSHVALVLDGEEWRFYLNGRLDSVRTGNTGLHLYVGTGASDGVVIGNQRLWENPPNPNGQCKSYFAETRVWSRARTGDEIAANWLTRIDKPWLEPALIGYLPLDDGKPGEKAEGQVARNCANIDVMESAKSSDYERYLQASVKGGEWVSVTDLPLTNCAPANRAVIRMAKAQNLQSNSVDSLTRDVTTHFTFTGWYLFGSRGTANWQENCIFSKAYAGNGRFHLREQNGTIKAWFGGGGNVTNEECAVDVSQKLPLGKWVHVAFVRDGGTVRLYLDGEMVGEAGGFTLPFLDVADYQFGGFDAGGSSGSFTGCLCEIGLWKTVLTPEQIRQAMYARPKGTERKLLGYWPMDDGEGNSLRNLKTGGPAAQPVSSKGRFERSTCANVPAQDGEIVFPPPPGMILLLK